MLILFDKLKDNDINLSEEFIKKINETINKDIKDTKGYRNISVMIRGSEHIPPKMEHINNLMMYFVYNYNNDSSDDIFYKIANYHLEFESIHPFEDDNGRTGRLLINYELLKENMSPIVIPKELRIEYFEYLRNKDIDGLAQFFKKLSDNEKQRLELFSFNN